VPAPQQQKSPAFYGGAVSQDWNIDQRRNTRTSLAVAAVLYVRTLPEGCRPLALVLPLLAWIAPLYNPPRLTPAGLITPLVLMGLIWLAFRKPPAAALVEREKLLPAP